MSTCRSCSAEVIFVPSGTTGKTMILDARPTKGVVLFAPREVGGEVEDNPSEAVAWVRPVYTDHHATCPEAAAWKGRTR